MILLGLVFLAHGSQKLFVYGIPGVAAAFGHMGLPAPALSALLATGEEFFGGAALALGRLTRWAAIPLAISMLVAVLGVHLRHGFFLPNGCEYALTMRAANVALILTGPGNWRWTTCCSAAGTWPRRRPDSWRAGPAACPAQPLKSPEPAREIAFQV